MHKAASFELAVRVKDIMARRMSVTREAAAAPLQTKSFSKRSEANGV